MLFAALSVTVAAVRRPFVSMPATGCQDFRPAVGQRRFVSQSVEDQVSRMRARMSDHDLACVFANAYPNPLDTTVSRSEAGTFVITGDIDAMWLRDASAQLLPYVRPFAANDTALVSLLWGAARMMAQQVVRDPWANAHNPSATTGNTPHVSDSTWGVGFLGTQAVAMTPWIFERKFEVDSLAWFLYFSGALSDTLPSAVDQPPPSEWFVPAAAAVLEVLTAMRDSAASPADAGYTFQRCVQSCEPTDTLAHGVGNPAAAGTGLIRSAFRPSDDACALPFFIPANMLAVAALRRAAPLLVAAGAPELAANFTAMADGVDAAIMAHGVVQRDGAAVWAYEVDGFGNSLFMDDANIPSLLAAPFFYRPTDPLHASTRAKLLSTATNPWFFRGSAGEGVGSPHTGVGRIWPMAVVTRALTAATQDEVCAALATVRASAAPWGFLHESIWRDDAGSFSRPWFAWANAYFGGAVLDLAARWPDAIYGTACAGHYR